MQDNSNNIGWFIAGLGLGALVGVLYAPKSGRETREALREGAVQGRDYIATRGREYGEQVTQLVDRGKEVLNRQKEQINSAIDAGRNAFREANTGGGGEAKG